MRAFDLGAYLDKMGTDDVTAVAARKAKHYVRVQLPNGRFVPETYVFGPGGVWSGNKVDDTIDNLRFLDIAHLLAGPLAAQDFVPGTNPSATKLLIMVYWGTTNGEEHATDSSGYTNLQQAYDHLNHVENETGASKPTYAVGGTSRYAQGIGGGLVMQAEDSLMTAVAAVAAENAARTQNDVNNVTMLGYDSWWEDTSRYENTPMRYRRQDLLDEVEDDRYFVVLMAYDLQAMLKQRKHRLLWETRFSIREHHHAFDQDLPKMALFASQFFGRDSHGVVHKEVPYGRVEIGPVQAVGESAGPSAPGSPSQR